MTAKDYQIEWRPLAREDLHSILRHIGKDNPARAASFGEELRAKTKRLAKHPELGRPGRLEGTRELVAHPNYIIFYRVLHESRTIQILRVKHMARQWR